MIAYEDFKKIELRIGEVVEIEPVPNSKNLLKLIVDIGTERRQIVAGIAQNYTKDTLMGKQVVLLINLEPKMIRGIESNGMLLAAVDSSDTAVLLTPDKKIAPGAAVL